MPAKRPSEKRRGPSSAAFATLAWCAALLAPCVSQASDDLAARRLQIEQMTPAEQQDLLRRQERFSTLPAEEQQRLRSLQATLDVDPHAKQLEQVLKQYHEWLKTLTPGQRAELAELGPADRVSQIKRIKQQQEAARQQARRADLLSSSDKREIMRWSEELVWPNREKYMAQMTPGRREAFERLDTSRQRHALLYFAYEHARKPGSSAMSQIEQQDIDRLVEKLSPGAKAALDEADSLQKKRRIVGGWIGAAVHHVEAQQVMRKLTPWVDDDLVQFFQKELRRSDRERLLKMPREQMVAELRKLYFEREQADSSALPGSLPPGRFRDGPPGDRPRGPRRGGPPPASTESPPQAPPESKP